MLYGCQRRNLVRTLFAHRRAIEDPQHPKPHIRGQGPNAAMRGVIASLQDLGFIIERANEPSGW